MLSVSIDIGREYERRIQSPTTEIVPKVKKSVIVLLRFLRKELQALALFAKN